MALGGVKAWGGPHWVTTDPTLGIRDMLGLQDASVPGNWGRGLALVRVKTSAWGTPLVRDKSLDSC